MSKKRTGVLAFEDGSVFRGTSFGAQRTVLGEAVFNTSMTGYQEILTDPSYFGQIVTMTAPQIGNYGVNPGDEESSGPKVSGFIVRDLSPVTSNWQSAEDLDSYLSRNGIPGVSGVDTRTITKRLRVHGALKACISTEDISDAEAVEKAKSWGGIVGADYVKEVTCAAPFVWDPDGLSKTPFTVPGTLLEPPVIDRPQIKIVAFDLGAKFNIYRKLRYHGFEVEVVPAATTAEEVMERSPSGLFLSNGPGDPSAVTYVHKTVATLIEKLPTFGICLGHQMLTHALGAETFKLKFGHRGGNQPVKNMETGKVSITSQNHGFASTKENLENRGAIVTEINLNDGTVEGLRHKELPVFSVQYHPEASPGPHDSDPLFDDFYELVRKNS